MKSHKNKQNNGRKITNRSEFVLKVISESNAELENREVSWKTNQALSTGHTSIYVEYSFAAAHN